VLLSLDFVLEFTKKSYAVTKNTLKEVVLVLDYPENYNMANDVFDLTVIVDEIDGTATGKSLIVYTLILLKWLTWGKCVVTAVWMLGQCEDLWHKSNCVSFVQELAFCIF